ncbi:class I SAM-dependent methyltransferase [Candidatus Babeliales bacterium]|nr:class I SAM-dependent methyltransferase [Candidatus Babeliales bacterium]
MPRSELTTYKKLCTEFYDLELKHRSETPEALAFFLDYAHRANGPILEPMCGTGRFLIPMLQAGFDVEGFDASSYMLEALKQNYAQVSNQPAPVWQEFVQDFDNKKQYKLIFVPFGSWGLISDLETAKKGLEIMYRHLAPGGKFVLEIETVASLPQPSGVWRQITNTRADGSQIALKILISYEPEKQLFKSLCRYESIVNDTVQATEEEDFYMYLYRFDEMDTLLAQAGFSHIKKYRNYQKEPATNPNTPIIFYECSKE